MAFFWLYAINGEHYAAHRSQRLDQFWILTGSRGHQREKNLAQQGDLFDAAREIRCGLELASHPGDRSVMVVSQLPHTHPHIQSKRVSTPSPCVFLVRTVYSSSSFTIWMTTFQDVAHRFDVLVSLNHPSRLLVSLCHCFMTCRTCVPWRIPVHLLTFTSVPGCSHEVASFLVLMIPSPSSPLTEASICLAINRLSEFYHDRKKSWTYHVMPSGS